MDITEKIRKFFVKLQGLPENKKKIILWTIVAVLAVIMGFFWVRGTMHALSEIGKGFQGVKLPEMNINMPSVPVPNIPEILKNASEQNLPSIK